MVERTRKITLIGYRSVGKTSLVMRYILKKFPETYDPTIESTYTKTVTFRDQTYELEVHDTAGQDSLPLYGAIDFINVDAWIFVYSIASLPSFEFLITAYKHIMDQQGNRNVPLVLVGNKCDLTTHRQVSRATAEREAKNWDVPFLEVSAKENTLVNEVFERVLMKISGGRSPTQRPCVLS